MLSSERTGDQALEMSSSEAEFAITNADAQPSSSLDNVNGSQEPTEARSASAMSARTSQGGIRSTSSKFASLRAAFEQGGSSGDTGADGVKRRLVSTDKGSEKNAGKDQDQEIEILKLREELEKERELRVAFEERVTSQEEEIEDLTEQSEHRDMMWKEEYERRSLREREEAAAQLSLMGGEARSLQKQLADLKRSVSTSTRNTTQVSDTTIRQEIGVLQHEVQNWVVNNFRRAKSDGSPEELCVRLEKVSEAKQFEFLRPVYSTFELAAKLPIYQATVACYMMEVFDEPYLFGLVGQRDWAKRVRQAADALPGVLETAAYNRWRAATFDALRQSERIKEPVESATNGIAEMICITLKALTDVEESEMMHTSLRTIVRRAVSLAHVIRVQQARYEFVLPKPAESFDADSMEDIADESESDTERTIRCATFPAIVKVSNDEGDHLDVRSLVVKAKVLCNAVAE